MKRGFRKFIILAVIFAAALALVAVFWTRRGGSGGMGRGTEYVIGSETPMPTVSFEYAGEQIDTLCGYTSEMDVSTLRGPLLPLENDRLAHIVVKTRGSSVSAVGWELMSTDAEGLIASETDTAISEQGEDIIAQAQLPPVLEAGKEYMLRVLVETEEHGKIAYYTRVSILEKDDIEAGLEFIHSFSDATFMRNRAEDFIVPYLESDMSVADNENLGYTDLVNSYRQVMWGEMYTQVSGTVRASFCETQDMGDSWVGSFTLEYQMQAVDEDGLNHIYAVREYYMLRRYYIDGTVYLLLWQRETDDITDPREADVSGGDITLGILSPRAAEDLRDDQELSGPYAAYAFEGRLWEYEAEANRMTLVWGGALTDDDGLLPEYGQRGCRVIYLDGESGDIIFAAYGLMTQGPRQGRCGLSLNRYERAEGRITEIFFMESDRPFEQMDAELSRLACVGADGTCYLFYNNSIYAIDTENYEPTVMTGGFRDGSYAISPDETRIAWAEGSGEYGYGTVYMMDLENGISFRALNAAYGEELEILGFSGHDLIVGRLRPSDAGTLADGTACAPMYSFSIYQEQVGSGGGSLDQALLERETAAETSADGSGTGFTAEVVLSEVTSYEEEGLFIQSIDTEGDHMTIYRLRSGEGSVYTAADNDTLIRNSSISASGTDMMARGIGEVRQRIWRLEAFDEGAVTGDLTTAAVTDLTVVSGSPMESGSVSDASQTYYAYACGRLYGIYTSASEAEQAVSDELGIVTDSQQNVIWTRLGSGFGRPGA